MIDRIIALFRRFRKPPAPPREIWCRFNSMLYMEPRREGALFAYSITGLEFSAGYKDGKEEFRLVFAPKLRSVRTRGRGEIPWTKISRRKVPRDIRTVAEAAFEKEALSYRKRGCSFSWGHWREEFDE